jgi:predicted phosphodiesterase
MSLLYPLTFLITGSFYSASYINEQDYDLFFENSGPDFWYGISDKDAIEVSIYDLNQNLLSWKSIDTIGKYKTSNSTYYDEKNNSVEYEYKQYNLDYPIYKTEKILVNPSADVAKFELSTGSYIMGYQFTRYLAGSPSASLVIKDISPSKTELKLIPAGISTIEYNSFCVGKIILRNVSPIYIQLTKNCPYNDVYKNSITGNESSIDLVKNIFFIPNDGKFVEFLKTIYEDFYKFSGISDDVKNTATRTQGIKTYFSNFLVSNTDRLFLFEEIQNKFYEYVNTRLDVLFINFKSDQYKPARNYLFDVFTKYYFDYIHLFIKNKYEQKFSGPLKNALSFGLGKYIPILNTSFIDERKKDSDPITLLVKLQYPLTDELSIKSDVWISNISMIPFLFGAVIKQQFISKTVKISPPDFTITDKNVSFSNSKLYHTNEELSNERDVQSDIDVCKKIQELNVDYSSFSNFIVFSSAGVRHNIFKNKMISISKIDDSLSNLEMNYSSSGYDYPYYSEEKDSLENKKYDIIQTFDGFESYLYKTGYYTYSTINKQFYSSSFVSNMDSDATVYDKNNRDSLVNNTPEYIVNDSENDDYLIFLSMVGHYFDNLYLYIKSLPYQRSSENVNDYSKNMLQNMLQSFGWKSDASNESSDISDNFLDSDLNGEYNISAEEKNRQVWSRILNTLPLIYKTKGTEECIKLVLSCYGIPSTLLNIREYGGVSYEDSDKISYDIDEKLFFLTYKGYREYVSLPFESEIKTVELKASLDDTEEYSVFEKIPLSVKYNQYDQVDWTVGVYKERQKNLGRVYFELSYPTYKIGLLGDYGSVESPTTQSFRVAQSITEYNPDIIITLGDNTYETNPTSAYDNTVGRLYHQFINPYVGVSGSGAIINRFFPVIGNHDYSAGSSYDAYQTFFPTISRFYTFKKGNIQFFMLNSDVNEPSGSSSTSAQSDWLKSELSSSFTDPEVIWRIACCHHDYISSGIPAHLAPWMDWSWKNLGVDLLINGHDHFYERLEDDIPIIIQGAGGAPLYNFTSIVTESRFRYNSLHSYSVIESRGNKLTITLYDMFGNKIDDTGTTTLPSQSIENGSFVMEKDFVAFSDKPFNQSDKYLLTDSIPIFNGEIFNVMVRKNYPDDNFEYNSVSDLIPTKYDLWVQKREDGRPIYSSYVSDIFTQTYNNKFSNIGTLYFGNYETSSSFKGLLDKILVWYSPITDSTFNDHCNNLNSYSFTGSTTPYEALYFRMNYDSPIDFSLSNPTMVKNQNEYYSSSVWGQSYNFGIQSFSASIDNCIITSHSVYPYQFTEIPYKQSFTITSYGPNKFKNEKIRKTNLELAVRLDPNDKSTYSKNQFISSDSNQIGLFIDPNDYKNKDIFRYLGDYGVVGLLSDPQQMFDDKYYTLNVVKNDYNRSGNKKTYYNEMFTLYKIYFDKAIFETIKQLIPARNSVLSGILIEPTVLERPKYQYKKLSSEANDFQYTSSKVSTLTSSLSSIPADVSVYSLLNSKANVSSDFIFVDFGTGSKFQSSLDLSIINDPTREFTSKIDSYYIPDTLNSLELGVHCDDTGKIIESHYSGSSHRYLVKNWTKENTWVKKGGYSKPQTSESQSVYIYKIEPWNDSVYESLVFTSSYSMKVDGNVFSNPNLSMYSPNYTITDDGYIFNFSNRTFKKSPNVKYNNVFYKSRQKDLFSFEYYNTTQLLNQYYETFSGYPRNHLTHKKVFLSRKSKQTQDTTIGEDGFQNGSLPIESIVVSNINVVKTDNVLS